MQQVNIFWFRRDLRLHDNAGLFHALKSGLPVVPLFIFDTAILDDLEEPADRRVTFIYNAISTMHVTLIAAGSSMVVEHGQPAAVFKELIKRYHVESVFTNQDYEPYATERDNKVAHLLQSNNISFNTYKDQVIFDKNEVIKDDGRPYTVFTPYSKRWLSKLNDFYVKSYPTLNYLNNFHKQEPSTLPAIEDIGFKQTNEQFPSPEPPAARIAEYDKTRDYPGIEGTSRIGVHLRFGTVSIRELVRRAQTLNAVFLKELIWREFYQMILWHFPKVGRGHAFKAEYEAIRWRNNEDEFDKWCKGQTGYPIVDAGMRQMNATGFMHNRIRMVTASFLAKHLLIDWRWGEAYFASKLLDYDLASNNGGWQWAAGSGCDAAPYFRIFNPYLQTKRFDAGLKYVRTWVPEFEEFSYPKPIVDHEFARKRCLEVYSEALKK